MTEQEATTLVSELYESFYSFLVRYAWRATSSEQMAEDLVQDSFLDLYRAVRQGDLIETPKAWLVCVVRRKLLRHVRHHLRTGAHHLPLDVLDWHPAGAVNDRALGDDIRDLLSVLSPREQEVLLLRLSSLKYGEIAEKLEISAKTVSALLTRAVNKLRGFSQKAGKEDGNRKDVEKNIFKTLQ